MKKLIRYIFNNFISIIKVFLISAFFVSLILTIYNLIDIKLDKDFLRNIFILITILVLLFFINFWKEIVEFCERYKNTYKLEKPYFTFFDGLILFFLFSILIIAIRFNGVILSFFSEWKLFLFSSLGLFIILFLLAYFYNGLKNCFPIKKQKEALPIDSDAHMLSDEPIQFESEDRLGRAEFIEDFYKGIATLPFTDSFVFGLHGDWGEGKTSVINLLRNKLKNNKNFLIVDFNPWFFINEKAILIAFFEQVEGALSKNFIFPNLKKLFLKYQNLILSGLSTTGFKLGSFSTEMSPDDFKQKLESFILRTNKKVIIFIDDIDRLSPKEILLIFKLVRLKTKFKNIIFILSFEYEKTVKKLNSILNDMGKDYIAKIVQNSIHLPKIERVYLDNLLLFSAHKIPEYKPSDLLSQPNDDIEISCDGIVSDVKNNRIEIKDEEENIKKPSLWVEVGKELEKGVRQLNLKEGDKIFVEGLFKDKKIIIKNTGKIVKFRLSLLDTLFSELLHQKKIDISETNEFDKEMVYFYRSKLSSLIKTLRDVKRFMNSLRSSLPSVAGEVDLGDFFLLEFIKVFNGELYDDIYDNWWFYVEQRSEGDIWFNPIHILDEGKKKQRIKEHITEVLKKTTKNQNEEELFLETLRKLFPLIEKSF